MQTNIKIEFTIIADKKLNFDDVTQRLGVQATTQRTEHINNKDVPQTSDVWEYATEKIETLDVKEVFSQITSRFMAKEEILKDIKQEYEAVIQCFIIVEIEQKQTPGLYIDKETLRFLSNIEAELDIDLYVLS